MDYEKNYYDYVNFVKNEIKTGNRPETKKDWNKLKKLGDNRYFEFHHIVPKSISNDNSIENLIPLTGREHFLAHYLLTKIYKDGDFHKKMIFAFNMLAHKHSNVNYCCEKYFNSRLYEKNRIEFSVTIKEKMTKRYISEKTKYKSSLAKLGQNNPSYKAKGENHWNKGMKRTEESKEKMKNKAKNRTSPFKGKHHSEESKEKMRKASIGKEQSYETRKKRSESLKGKTLGRKATKDSREKMSKSALKRNYKNKRKFKCVETNDVFQTQTEASRFLNIPGHIKLCLNDKNKTCGGYHFEWI